MPFLDFDPRAHRTQLFAQLPFNSVALIFSGQEQLRNRDVDYPFRAHSDFWYLSAFAEPDCVLLLIKTAQAEQTLLFLRPKDLEQETWQGRRLGVDAAVSVLGVDAAYPIETLSARLPDLCRGLTQLFFSFSDMGYWMPLLVPVMETLKSQVRKGIDAPAHFSDLDPYLHEQRLIKNEKEVALMREAAQISVQGHLAAMAAAAQKSATERQVQAALEAAFFNGGAQRVAFNSICASGENACILHYTENNTPLEANALLLVDAGAEYQGYAGDITHTFPPSGKFTREQAALYRLVLDAQQAVIAKIAPGVTYQQLHQITLQVLTEGLHALGILNGDPEELVANEACKAFFMHGTGHWLGLDVHDVGLYKLQGAWRPLQAGMVITVEPGIYISSRHTTVDAKWHGIGIRIEDDVLVTAQGCDVLSKGLPRTPEAIEAWFANYAATHPTRE
ncbi:MAG: aminopeptidase P N-terminal domain-containing protein [Thiotrichales bacterium]|nr:aminopeptidase P N-terminal domain-containing protein [Thiotrichales bacterium]